MSYELEDISGIGKSTAEKMKAAGIDSIEKLVTVKPDDLLKLKIKGVGKATAEKIITNAKKVFEEIGEKTKTSTVIKEKTDEKTTSKSKPKSTPVSKVKGSKIKDEAELLALTSNIMKQLNIKPTININKTAKRIPFG